MSLFGRAYGRDISGRVFKDGREIGIGSVASAIRHGLAYVSEDRKRYGLNLIESIRRNMSSAAPWRFSSRGVLDLHEERRAVAELSAQMNVRAPTIESPVGGLSGGNQQKVVLGKWVATEPDVLILDEPTRGIDVGAKYEIYTIINRLADAGKAVLVISSELPEVLRLANRIAVMAHGRIIGTLNNEEATQENIMELATVGQEQANGEVA